MTILDINKVNIGNKARVYTKDNWRLEYYKSKKAYKASYGSSSTWFTEYEYENAEVISMLAVQASGLVVHINLCAE